MADRTVKVRLVAEHSQYRRAMAECGKDTKDVNKEVDKLDGRNIDVDTKPAQRGLDALQDSVEKSTAKILAMKAAFKETGDVSILRDLRKEEGNLRRLTGWVRALGDESDDTSGKVGRFGRIGATAGKGVSAFATAATDAGGAMKLLANPVGAMTAVLGVTAAASIASSAAVAGLGVGIVGLGAIALRNSVKVQTAFGAMQTTIDGVGKRSAAVLEGTFERALFRLGATAASLEPTLTRMFTNVRPGVDALTTGVDGLARNAMPGLEDASEGANRVLVTLGEELPGLGASVSRFGTALGVAAGDGKLLAQALGAVSTTLDILGPSLVTLSKAGEIASIGMNNFGGILEMVQGKHEGVSAQMPKFITDLRNIEAAFKAAGLQAKTYGEKLHDLNEINMSTAEAQIQYQTGLNNLTAALRTNKGAWEGVSNSALANKQIVIDQIEVAKRKLSAQYEQIKATQGEAAANKWATATHATMRTAIINAAGAAGIHKTKVAQLVDQLFRVPKTTTANVRANTAQAAAAVRALQTQLANLVKRKYSAVISGQLDYFGGDTVRKAHGGMLPGPVDASRRQDNGIFYGQSGEWVTPVDRTRQYLPVLKAINAGTLPMYASGGLTGPPYTVRVHADVSRASAVAAKAARSAQMATEPHLGSPGGSSIGKLLNIARNFHSGAYLTSGYRPGDPGWHGRGYAADIVGGGASGMAQIARGFYGMSGRLLELIHSGGGGFFVKNGRRVGPYAQADHWDHVHVAAYGQGGRYQAGGPMRVGEFGPETLIPDSPGYVRSRPWEGSQLTQPTPVIHNHFYVDGQEIRGITRSEIGAWQTEAGRQLAHGRR